MPVIVHKTSLVENILQDWHALCEQYRPSVKAPFALDADVSDQDNAQHQIPDQLIKSIQRYHRLPKLLRWLWRMLWRVDDLYQPLVIYYASNAQITWQQLTEQCFDNIPRIELFIDWVQKKANTLISAQIRSDQLLHDENYEATGQGPGQNLPGQSSSISHDHKTEENTMRRYRQRPVKVMIKRRARSQFNNALAQSYQTQQTRLHEIAINQNLPVEKMREMLNEVLTEAKSSFGDLYAEFAAHERDPQSCQEQSNKKLTALALYAAQIIQGKFQAALNHLIEAGQKQVDQTASDNNHSIEGSLAALGDTLTEYRQHFADLLNEYTAQVSDPRYYQQQCEIKEQSFGIYVAQATGQLENLRRKNWQDFQTQLAKKATGCRKHMEDDVSDNPGLPKQQWLAIEAHLTLALTQIDVLYKQYQQSGRVYDEKESLEAYETHKQKVTENLLTYACRLQQQTGGLVPYIAHPQNSAQLIMWWQYDQPKLTDWMAKKYQGLGRLIDPEQRRIAIGIALTKLEKKCRELRARYHPDKYPDPALKALAEQINTHGIAFLEQRSQRWLMMGSQFHAKYLPKTAENELDFAKLADPKEQEAMDELVKMSMLWSGCPQNLRQHYKISEQLSSCLTQLRHYCQQLAQSNETDTPHPTLPFWQACVQWYQYSLGTWRHFLGYWEHLHFVKPCKNKEDEASRRQYYMEISELHTQLQDEVIPASRTMIDQLSLCCDEKSRSPSPQNFPTLSSLKSLHDVYEEFNIAHENYQEIEKVMGVDAFRLPPEERAKLAPYEERYKTMCERIDICNEKSKQLKRAATTCLSEAALIQAQYHLGEQDLALLDTIGDDKRYERIMAIATQLETQYQRFLDNSNTWKEQYDDLDNRNAREEESYDYMNYVVLFIWLCRSQIQALRWGQAQWQYYQQGIIQQPPLSEEAWGEVSDTILESLQQYCDSYRKEADTWDAIIVKMQSAKQAEENLRQAAEGRRQAEENLRQAAEGRRQAEERIVALERELADEKKRIAARNKPSKNRQKPIKKTAFWHKFFTPASMAAPDNKAQGRPPSATEQSADNLRVSRCR